MSIGFLVLSSISIIICFIWMVVSLIYIFSALTWTKGKGLSWTGDCLEISLLSFIWAATFFIGSIAGLLGTLHLFERDTYNVGGLILSTITSAIGFLFLLASIFYFLNNADGDIDIPMMFLIFGVIISITSIAGFMGTFYLF